MKELSIFVDESGDLGPFSNHSPFYIVSMVFHDQLYSISREIAYLDRELEILGLGGHVIHTEPLIRREEDYKDLSPNERRAIFTKLFFFLMKCPVRYKAFLFRKDEYHDLFKLQGRIAREISRFIRQNLVCFQTYDRVILYYDNGQHELNRILNTVLAAELSQYDVRKVLPIDYKLFQTADLICTLTLLEQKCTDHRLSRSELLLFHNERSLRKDFLKPLKRKEWI
ncbi:MAG: DUF3800 domain-containing protein [Erysipelotrichaceae bacterium]|nr:DUF3800 domain-containing protein [Erysipelotrichaceae bacterium]